METSFEAFRKAHPNATLHFSVDKFDIFLHHLKKMIREEFDREYKAMRDSREEVYYSFRHVASMLDVSERTLNRWQSQGYLVPRMIGGQRRYRKSDLDRIIHKEGGDGHEN